MSRQRLTMNRFSIAQLMLMGTYVALVALLFMRWQSYLESQPPAPFPWGVFFAALALGFGLQFGFGLALTSGVGLTVDHLLRKNHEYDGNGEQTRAEKPRSHDVRGELCFRSAPNLCHDPGESNSPERSQGVDHVHPCCIAEVRQSEDYAQRLKRD